MGENSGDKVADTNLGTLCELFSKILEQQQSKTSPDMFKSALEPNPVKLAGPGNYISWARHAKLILGSHGYDYLLVPDDKEEEKGGASNKQINDRVFVWLMSSMEISVREQIETMNTVSEVWYTLEKQFAGKSNKMQATRIMHELANLNQGTRSVSEYAGEMKKLYRDLHYYHKWFEPFVGKLFLDGLHSDFDFCRRLIFAKSEWPCLDDIISNVMEEEMRLANLKEKGQKSVHESAALSMQAHQPSNYQKDREKEKLFCDHCKTTGHTKEKCFKLHGYPPGWKKGKPRIGGVQGSIWNQANQTSSTGKDKVRVADGSARCV
uniref:Retrotransposon gag domain-containing protein n=1 Tax=Leersia perrieri TaxID=77586 RepID=A0A0D9VA30_9ORYZ